MHLISFAVTVCLNTFGVVFTLKYSFSDMYFIFVTNLQVHVLNCWCLFVLDGLSGRLIFFLIFFFALLMLYFT